MVRVYDIVDAAEAPWIVMEYVPARSLHEAGVVVSDDKAYGFWWSTSESQWTASLPYLDIIFRSFQPAG